MTIRDTSDPLHIFVAMPGTDMGPKAYWNNPEDIKKSFPNKISDRLKNLLDRDIDLVIEKDKNRPGTIYKSMFQEAWDADVYIADLTGANPNVYLELGVRWALRDAVTVLVCQDLSEIKFNVAASRAIQYGVNPTVNDAAIDKVVETILYGLHHETHCDSPVRENASIKAIATREYEELVSEFKRLQSERGEELLSAARVTSDPQRKIELLRQAIQRNPSFLEAHIELGISLRKISQYREAAAILREGIKLDPGCAICYRELGVALSKQGELDLAAEALRYAVNHDPNDFDGLSVLGGVHRRIGMKHAPDSFDWESLKASKECYEKASAIKPLDTYPLLNVARLDLLLSKIEPQRKDNALQAFDELRDLCSFEARKAEKNLRHEDAAARETAYWRIFDHAEALLFSGHLQAATTRFQDGINLVSAEERESVLSSVSSPLRNYLLADVFEEPLRSTIKTIVDDLETSRTRN